MACIAGKSTGMAGRSDLREGLRFRAVAFVTAGAYHSRVELRRRNGCRIVSVLSKGSVAGLTRNHHVFAQLFLVDNVGVASLADLMSRVRNRTGCDVSHGISAIVAVLAEAVRSQDSPNQDKRNHCNCDDYSQPNEMFDVLEHVRLLAAPVKRYLRSKRDFS